MLPKSNRIIDRMQKSAYLPKFDSCVCNIKTHRQLQRL